MDEDVAIDAVRRGLDRATCLMSWGTDDCALWVADIVRDARGYDPAADWRGAYKTRAGATALLGPLGLPRALRRAALRWGWTRVDPADARAGDVALAVLPALVDGHLRRLPTTLICGGAGWFFARTGDGFAGFPGSAVRPRICWSTGGTRA